MTGEEVALTVLSALVRTAPVIVEVVTGVGARELEERIARARAAIRDPIDPSADDAERRRRLEAAIRGEP